MKEIIKFIIVLLLLALCMGLVYSMLSPVLNEFFPDDTTNPNDETKSPFADTTEPLESEIVEPEETEPNHVHAFSAFEVVKEATCKDKGLEKAVCEGCTATQTREIAKLTTHSYDDGVITTEATCVKEGVTTYTCTVCGYEKTGKISKSSRHTYENYVCKLCGAADPDCPHNSKTTYTYGTDEQCYWRFEDECHACNSVVYTWFDYEHDFIEGECTNCGASDPDYEDYEPEGCSHGSFTYYTRSTGTPCYVILDKTCGYCGDVVSSEYSWDHDGAEGTCSNCGTFLG